ncbi:MAG TPA: Ig-like domain-containing protein, partial [Thermoanaerobaculia bacterium]|nr:Ig-like domain-containing protein [Thermoanaerobaculia bacterium]
SKYLLKVYRNDCGDSSFTATTESPTISAGQAATLNIALLPPVDVFAYFGTTGQFTIKEGAQVLATASFQFGRGSVTINGLSLGNHALTASYDGDPQYGATTAAPLTLHVTNATTTTAVSIDPAAPVYSQGAQIHATVMSSTGDTPGGPIRFVIDGQSTFYSPGTAPQATTYGPTTVGSHTVVVNYIGDATHPPSSATQTYVVSKQKPQITLGLASTAANAAFNTSLYLSSAFSGSSNPTGSVTLSEGATSLGTKSLDSYPLVYFDFPPLAPGRHEFRVVYTGDANYQAMDTFLTIIAFATTSASVDARGNANNISVVWYPTSFIAVSRKTPGQAWTKRMCCSPPPFTDSIGVQPETVYLYRAESYDGSSLSNVDVGMRISFTDDPLLPGAVMRSVYLQEIVHAANLLRAAANLSAISASPFVAGAPVTAAGINLLRTAINEARVSLGAYPFAFTGTPATGVMVGAADIRELREAVR